jgi:hypothetical protein
MQADFAFLMSPGAAFSGAKSSLEGRKNGEGL